jgi:type IV secretion system protein VirB9
MTRLWHVWLMAGTMMAVPAFGQSKSNQAVSPSPGFPTVTAGSRTILYHPRDLVAVQAKVRYTTLIVLPDGEDIVEATCGDKEFWIVNVHGPVAYVKPAKASSETNLNLLTASGQIYAFRLTEISASKDAAPDLAVYLEPEDAAAFTSGHHAPKYVPAEQVEDYRAQAELAKDQARRATQAAEANLQQGLTAFRATYPLALKFVYRFKPDVKPFFVHAMFHDDHVTYIQAQARELPVLYEIKDGAPNLITFDVRGGTYVVPKILDNGYFAIGQARFVFTRDEAR